MSLLDRLLGRESDEPTTARLQGDPTVLDREDDPQGHEYRHADPRDVVEDAGVAMSGPGGAPQEGQSVEERRELDRKTD